LESLEGNSIGQFFTRPTRQCRFAKFPERGDMNAKLRSGRKTVQLGPVPRAAILWLLTILTTGDSVAIKAGILGLLDADPRGLSIWGCS
jgi:hypothetical protein